MLTHRAILRAIWGPNALDQPEHLRVLIGALRKKIEANPASPRYILTEPWVGYRFADEEMVKPMREALALAGGLAAVAAATFAYTTLLDISNPATVSTTYLLVVLVIAAISTFRVAVAISMAAVLAFNFFFLPPSAPSRSPTRRTGRRCSRFSRSAWSPATSRRWPARAPMKRARGEMSWPGCSISAGTS